MKVATVLAKVFEAADAATLEAAYEAWRATQGENQYVDCRVTYDGTNIVMVVLYTR